MLQRCRQIEVRAFLEVERVGYNPLVVSRAKRDPHRTVDRHRQHEAVVVVGVVADEIDAARRAREVVRSYLRIVARTRRPLGQRYRCSRRRSWAAHGPLMAHVPVVHLGQSTADVGLPLRASGLVAARRASRSRRGISGSWPSGAAADRSACGDAIPDAARRRWATGEFRRSTERRS